MKENQELSLEGRVATALEGAGMGSQEAADCALELVKAADVLGFSDQGLITGEVRVSVRRCCVFCRPGHCEC